PKAITRKRVMAFLLFQADRQQERKTMNAPQPQPPPTRTKVVPMAPRQPHASEADRKTAPPGPDHESPDEPGYGHAVSLHCRGAVARRFRRAYRAAIGVLAFSPNRRSAMRTTLWTAAIFSAGVVAGQLVQPASVLRAQGGSRVFELRTYTAPEGKLGALQA